MGSYGLGFDTRQLRFRLCSLCGGPEADGMRWAGEVREGWRERTSTDQCMPNGRQHRPNPEWVGGQNSERLFSAWRAVKSQGMERPVEVARESRVGVIRQPTRLSVDEGPGWPAVHI
jgi:hypothetical protein